jgi:hypothetical protein
VALERTNAWFARHGGEVLALASGAVGVYLVIVGVVELITQS